MSGKHRDIGAMDIQARIKLLQGHQVSNMEFLKKRLEAKQTQVHNINTRVDRIKSQNRSSIQNEYDRLRGELNKSSLPHQSVQTIRDRTKRLREMGANSATTLPNLY